MFGITDCPIREIRISPEGIVTLQNALIEHIYKQYNERLQAPHHLEDYGLTIALDETSKEITNSMQLYLIISGAKIKKDEE